LDADRQSAIEALLAFSEPFKNVPVEEIEREVAKAIAEVRAEDRVTERERQVVARNA